MVEIAELLRDYRVVPVAAVDKVDDGLRLCESLLAAGLRVVEINFRTVAAEAAIRAVTGHYDEMVVGAGTVLNVADLKRAAEAGARFAAAPGCNPAIITAAAHERLPFMPGIASASDLERAAELGAKTLNLFPAEVIGGVNLLRALIGAYGHLELQFVPSGGITAHNMGGYLALTRVAAVGGTWLATRKQMQAGDWQGITRLAAEALTLARQAPKGAGVPVGGGGSW